MLSNNSSSRTCSGCWGICSPHTSLSGVEDYIIPARQYQGVACAGWVVVVTAEMAGLFVCLIPVWQLPGSTLYPWDSQGAPVRPQALPVIFMGVSRIADIDWDSRNQQQKRLVTTPRLQRLGQQKSAAAAAAMGLRPIVFNTGSTVEVAICDAGMRF